ncbi:MAG: hypothetical protein AB7P14_19580 [Blastocatellales bacterium]
MPESRSQISNSQTLVIESKDFNFETVEQENGVATIVRFKLENPSINPGDVLLILSGEEIHFHGFIGGIEDGWATAIDRRGSSLPAGVH